jgi:isopentenyldiphosphate isomerase
MQPAERELIDVCDADGAPVGVATRAEAHARGLWHRSLHCWVHTGDALLFQRRAADRPHWAGYLDITAAGHLAAGETWQDALREAEEEIGLPLRPDEVRDAGERRDELRFGKVVDRELCRIVLVRRDAPVGAYRLGPEVAELVAVPFGEVEGLDGVVPRPAAYYREIVRLALQD